MNFIKYYLIKQLGKNLVESSLAPGQPYYSNIKHRPYRPVKIRQKPDSDVDFLYYRGVIQKSQEELNLLVNYLKDYYISYFYNKFENLSLEDVEDAFQESISKLVKNKEPIRPGHSIAQLFHFMMNNQLFSTHRRKVTRLRNMDKIKDSRSSIWKDEEIDDSMPSDLESAIKDAELTREEITTLRLSANGEGVRSIAEKLNVSNAKAWRILNKAIDKIRAVHKLPSRGLGIDKRKI